MEPSLVRPLRVSPVPPRKAAAGRTTLLLAAAAAVMAAVVLQPFATSQLFPIRSGANEVSNSSEARSSAAADQPETLRAIADTPVSPIVIVTLGGNPAVLAAPARLTSGLPPRVRSIRREIPAAPAAGEPRQTAAATEPGVPPPPRGSLSLHSKLIAAEASPPGAVAQPLSPPADNKSSAAHSPASDPHG
jgi:hypothetical protein